ncbi:MAG TPA: FIST N-terminal domain-containing protein [Kofleriaceae bacterium]|nr:FIST N-terminal domain-containing protein [Kofleriaceae bacterium]
MLRVKRGMSHADSEATVAAELAAQVADPSATVALVFASPRYDAARLAAALQRALGPVPVVGCTTAGEIGATGFLERSVVAMTLASSALRLGIGLSSGLSAAAFTGGRRAAGMALASLGSSLEELSPRRHVAVSLIDGRSGREETFIAGASAALPGLRIVGGSASDVVDGPPAARTFFGGEALTDTGMLLIFDSDIPFLAFKSEHMLPTDERVVVTSVEPGERLVHELNGRPAREVYARLIGISADAIDPAVAGRNPFALYVGGQPYVRSVMSLEGDSLRFACAVDQGSVLRPMTPGDLVRSTADDLARADAELGGIGALVAFNCLGRYLESQAAGNTQGVADVLTRYPVVGFNTFGEQFNALHVNHTLTALAFAKESRR